MLGASSLCARLISSGSFVGRKGDNKAMTIKKIAINKPKVNNRYELKVLKKLLKYVSLCGFIFSVWGQALGRINQQLDLLIDMKKL